MMHNGGINIIRRPLHVREGLAKIFGVTICIAPLGTSINDVRFFSAIFNPPPPLMSDFYLLKSDFLGSF